FSFLKNIAGRLIFTPSKEPVNEPYISLALYTYPFSVTSVSFSSKGEKTIDAVKNTASGMSSLRSIPSRLSFLNNSRYSSHRRLEKPSSASDRGQTSFSNKYMLGVHAPLFSMHTKYERILLAFESSLALDSSKSKSSSCSMNPLIIT